VCNACSYVITFERKHRKESVAEHLNSTKLKNKSKLNVNPNEILIDSNNNSDKAFNEELCEAFISVNIKLQEIEN
jgi:hypothetical protein